MPINVAIAYHSNGNSDAIRDVSDSLKQIKIDAILLNESTPTTLLSRSGIIQACSVLIVVASRNFQNTVSCMELLHYAKDLKKKVVMINPNTNFKPFGSLGAIGASSEFGILQVSENKTLDIQIEKILNYFTNQRPKSSKTLTAIDAENNSKLNLTHSNIKSNVLVSYHAEAAATFDLIKEALNNEKINFLGEECTSGKSSILTSQLLVVIMSAKYEESDYALQIVETAKAKKLPIIPVSISKSFKSDKWLGLVIAGKLYYRLFSKEEAYKQFFDTTPINNFTYGIKFELALSDLNNREQIEIMSLKKRLDECKTKLPPGWTPKLHLKSEIINSNPVKVTLTEPKADLYLHYIHTELTRMSFNAPKLSYDAYGVPLRKEFDCMISYQWDYQNLVRSIYTDLSTRELNIWFDIWGGMEGNSNECMATAIESSKTVVVFLSDSYQKSANCKLELTYAIYCAKPILFIIVQPNMEIESWIRELIRSNYRFEVYSLADLAVITNNVSKLDAIAQAIRQIGAAQPEIGIYELSEEVYNLKLELNDALDEIAANTGKERYKTCTRCKKQYEIENPIGCKKHRTYYMGGTLIAGRWFCCQQQDKNAIGCENTTHTDKVLQWTVDPNYGTYTWS